MRVDRDTYIHINWDNVLPNRKDQFEKCESCDDGGLEYDIGSVMHYHAYAFAFDRKKPTIVPIHGTLDDIGQRNSLSALDIEGVNQIYCPGYNSKCSDKDVKCPKWEKFCDGANRKDYVVIECPFTCRVCTSGEAKKPKCVAKDRLTFCKKWKTKWCDDKKWKKWMAKNCGETCKACG